MQIQCMAKRWAARKPRPSRAQDHTAPRLRDTGYIHTTISCYQPYHVQIPVHLRKREGECRSAEPLVLFKPSSFSFPAVTRLATDRRGPESPSWDVCHPISKGKTSGWTTRQGPILPPVKTPSDLRSSCVVDAPSALLSCRCSAASKLARCCRRRPLLRIDGSTNNLPLLKHLHGAGLTRANRCNHPTG